MVKQFQQLALQVGSLRRRLKSLRLESSGCGRCAGGRGRGGLAFRRRISNSATPPLPTAKRYRAASAYAHGKAKKRHLLHSPLPKMPASSLPLWQMAGDSGGGGCTASLLPCMQGGFYYLRVNLRARGVAVAMHTSPLHCNQQICIYIAVWVLLWHLQHPTIEWRTPPPPPLKNLPCQGGSVRPCLMAQHPRGQDQGSLPFGTLGGPPLC